MVVQRRVQVAKGEGLVAGEQRQTGPPQVPPPQPDGIGMDRRERVAVDRRRPACVTAGDDGPQAVTKAGEFLEEHDAPVGPCPCLTIEKSELEEQVAAPGLHFEAARHRQLGGMTLEGTAAWEREAPVDARDRIGLGHGRLTSSSVIGDR